MTDYTFDRYIETQKIPLDFFKEEAEKILASEGYRKEKMERSVDRDRPQSKGIEEEITGP